MSAYPIQYYTQVYSGNSSHQRFQGYQKDRITLSRSRSRCYFLHPIFYFPCSLTPLSFHISRDGSFPILRELPVELFSKTKTASQLHYREKEIERSS